MFVRNVYRQIWDDRAFHAEGARMELSITMIDLTGAALGS